MLSGAVIFALLVALVIYKYVLKPRNFPPGPPRAPLLGSTPFMPEPFGQQFMFDMPKKFGDICAFYIGPQPAVLLSEAKVIREVFKMTELGGRMWNRPFDDLRYFEDETKVTGVIFSNDSVWEEQRRFSLKNLRDMGMGKSSMDDIISDEMIRMCNRLCKTIDEPISLSKKMNLSIVSALWAILTSETMDLDDPESLSIIEGIDNSLRSGNNSPTLVSTLAPDLYKKFSKDYAHITVTFKSIIDMIQPHIDEHLKTIDPNNPKDFMDLYLIEMTRSNHGSSFNGTHGRTSLLCTFIDLFLAGTETTSSTLVWTFLYMVTYPEIQAKVHREIDSVVGDTRSVKFEDRDLLPFTQAVILESMRFSSLIPFGVPRRTTSDVQYGGYTIPKNTTVIANLAKVHYDPAAWNDPYNFKPERFIDGNGRLMPNNSHLMPFSVGRRFCLGQSLAEKELFLFFSGIMQRFSLKCPKGYSLPDVNIKNGNNRGLIRLPPIYHLQLTKRSFAA